MRRCGLLRMQRRGRDCGYARTEGYGMEQKGYEGNAVAPLAFPDGEIAVREFLRSGGLR
jgi:hypothetical protein